ncbi:hypothetical protein REPUB_Repub03eG0153900 [Reevesia pubescens]
MVLSSYSNWGTHDVQNFNSNPIYQTKPVEEQLVASGDYHQYFWELPNSAFLDPYIELNNNIIHPENYTPLLPYYSSPYQNLTPSYPCPKLIEDPYYSSDFTMPAFFDGVASPMPQDQKSMHQNQIKLEGNVENSKKSNEKCVSVQSIAARERRRKITEKTQELGKLVPGGNKMNTAEMFQSAFKYIKYLQAQVGILQVIDSIPENENGSWKENMEIVASTKVQEKLYMEEKCLIPKDVVLSLTTLSKSPVSDELRRLILPLALHH